MENTIRTKIESACKESSFLTTKIYSNDKHHSYQVQAHTILQINQNIIPIYGSADVVEPNGIIILGYCNDLSFLDSL